MLTLQELKQVVSNREERRKVPSAKYLRENEVAVAKQRLMDCAEIIVYQTGYVLYCVGEYATVFPLFTRKSNYTDDTIMTVAVTDWLLYGGNLVQVMHRYGREFPCPMGGYGARFGQWLCETNPQPYNSRGNGSAMRVSAVGWAFGSLEKTLQVAEETAAVSHNHPEGIKGAQAVAAVIYLARTGKSKQAIREYIETTFLYDLNFSCDEIRPDYCFNPSCQGTVPEAIVAFLESTDFETAIRLAISLGGDSDTLACITGGIAEAFYGMSEDWRIEVLRRLPEAFVEVVEEFYQKIRL